MDAGQFDNRTQWAYLFHSIGIRCAEIRHDIADRACSLLSVVADLHCQAAAADILPVLKGYGRHAASVFGKQDPEASEADEQAVRPSSILVFSSESLSKEGLR